MTAGGLGDKITPTGLDPAGVRAILLDIEGTVTPIAFVHEVLFPYARSHVESYLASHFDNAETKADIERLRQEHAADMDQDLGPPMLIEESTSDQIESMVSYVHWLIERDRKSTGLKSLQGKIWRQGYQDGTLKAPLFADVKPALVRWSRAGLKICIFSSGSAVAQQLFFGHTELGDLTHLIDGYFDTTTGSKTATNSYQRIALAQGRAEEEVLFISDVVAELDAANAAGLRTLLCVRPGNPAQVAGYHQVINNFDEIPSFVSPMIDVAPQ
jgi:enolase-phosphatase E1